MILQLPWKTNRLEMRPFSMDDAADFSSYRSDPEVARYQGWQAPYSLEKAGEFIARLEKTVPATPGEWYQIAICLSDGGRLIGDCGFFLLSEDPRQAEVGLTITRDQQGKGYGTEALGCLVGHLFHDFGLHRVRANIDPDNFGSAGVLRRLGFRLEGHMLESLWFKGRYAGEDWYAILEREWGGKVE